MRIIPPVEMSLSDYFTIAEKAIVIQLPLADETESQLFFLDGEWVLAIPESCPQE